MAEGAIPTLGFTLTYVLSNELKLALAVGAALAVVALVVRIVQKQPVQFVVNSLVGIAIAAVFALRSGKAEDVFLPGIIYNAGYAGVMTVSILVRWPVVGFMIGSVIGDPTGWRTEPAIVRLCSRLTWLLVLPCLIRVAVQYPLYLAGRGRLARRQQDRPRLAAADRGARRPWPRCSPAAGPRCDGPAPDLTVLTCRVSGTCGASRSSSSDASLGRPPRTAARRPPRAGGPGLGTIGRCSRMIATSAVSCGQVMSPTRLPDGR